MCLKGQGSTRIDPFRSACKGVLCPTEGEDLEEVLSLRLLDTVESDPRRRDLDTHPERVVTRAGGSRKENPEQ